MHYMSKNITLLSRKFGNLQPIRAGSGEPDEHRAFVGRCGASGYRTFNF
jgi:hypothetical protein